VKGMRCRIPLVVLAGLLSSCVSATVHLYTLWPNDPDPQASPAKPVASAFLLERLQIPKAIDRKELIVRKSNRELALLENDNWAYSLRDETIHALVENLNLALAASPTTAVPEALRPSLIFIDIEEWEATHDGVTLRANWQVNPLDAVDRLDLHCQSMLRESSTGNPDDLVRADQLLVKRLALSIARAMISKKPERCAL
jgi:uncharacterized lipoprotein YmbA